jgi:hypothetical protein
MGDNRSRSKETITKTASYGTTSLPNQLVEQLPKSI